MSLIADDPMNRDAVASLTGELRGLRGIIPFVGAGLSVPWRLPAWTPFLIEAGRSAGVEPTVRAELEAGRYEEAAETIARAMPPGAFDQLISDTFSDERTTAPQGRVAMDLIPEVARGPVVTTNFDHILERVFRDAGRPFDLELWGAKVSIATDALAEDYRLLLKMHGDADVGVDRVLTCSEYARHYGGLNSAGLDRGRPLPRLLGRLFASRPVLFLGCSLRNDRYLDVLGGLKARGRRHEHFAVAERPREEAEYRRRLRFYRDLHITPVWYPAGRHELLLPFLEEMAGVANRPGVRGVPLPVSVAPSAPVPGEPDRDHEHRIKRDRLRLEWGRLAGDGPRIAFVAEHGEFLKTAGFWPDYVKFAREAVECAKRLGRTVDAAELLNNLSLLQNRLGDRRLADQSLTAAWQLIRRRPRERLHVAVLHNLALSKYHEGRWAEAEAAYRKALEAADRIGMEPPASLLRNLGVSIARNGDRREGTALIRRAMRRSADAGDVQGEVRALILLADLCDAADDWAGMRDALEEAEDRLRSLPVRERQTAAQIFDNLGVCHYHLGNLEESVRYYLMAVVEEQMSDDRPALISTLLNLAWLHFDSFARPDAEERRDADEVRLAAYRRSGDYHEQALARARALRSRSAVARVLSQKAPVTAALGDRPRALEELKEAAGYFRRRRAYADLGRTMNNLGRVIQGAPEGPSKALRYYRAALRWAEEARDIGLERNSLYNLAKALRDAGRVAEALETAETLMSLSRGHADRYSRAHRRLYRELLRLEGRG